MNKLILAKSLLYHNTLFLFRDNGQEVKIVFNETNRNVISSDYALTISEISEIKKRISKRNIKLNQNKL